MAKRLLRRTSQIIGSLTAFLLLFVPSALTMVGMEDMLISGLALQAAPNALSVSWPSLSGVTVDHYLVSYAKQSILGNNGRFDDQEETIGNETSLVLLDLQNRGFSDGEMIFVTVSGVDAAGRMSTVGEEQSMRVQIPGTGASSSQTPGSAPGLTQAVAESATSVKLYFSTPVRLPADNPAAHFAITEETTTNPIGILSAVASGQDIILTTLPMTSRGRYSVAVSDAIVATDGLPLDQTRRTAVFVARGEEVVLDLPPLPDTTAPETPRNLTLRRVLQKNGLYTVHASWEESLNTEGDLAAYYLYESANRASTFVGPTALQATITSTTIADVPPGTLTLKVTAVDEIPNESAGIEETIILPETGAALTLLLSLAGAGAMARRRKGRQSLI